MARNVFITCHYSTHGIAFLKHILSWFYENNTVKPPSNVIQNLEQESLNDVFDKSKGNIKFDKIFYLYAPQKAYEKVTSRYYNYKYNYKNDEILGETGLAEIYDQIRTESPQIVYNLNEEINWVDKHYPMKLTDFKKYLWRDIQHYQVKTQINWLKTETNFGNVYNDEFQEIELNLTDLRNIGMIFEQIRYFIDKYLHKDDHCVIDISLSGPETQVAWYILADNYILPPNTSFIQTYDNKLIKNKYFKPFDITCVPTNLIEKIRYSEAIFEHTKSNKRQLVRNLFNTYLNTGFPILLLGERGIGKSHLVRNFKDKERKYIKIIEANCASFTNNSIAESELFGYVKNAFTDAKKDKKGLIEEAENGVLFLDEIHHLSEIMQAKLMKAFQTDIDNNFKIRKVGGITETTVRNVKLVFATNKTIKELHKILLPDFYDRIVQYVIEIPPLRETREDLEKDFKSCFDYLYPHKKGNAPKDNALIKWIKTLEMKGNYRDLQNIIRDYTIFLDFDELTRQEICDNMEIPNSPLEYTKKCYEKYHSNPISQETIPIQIPSNINLKSIEKEFKKQIYKWALSKYSTRKEAAKQLCTSEKTLGNWKRQ